VTRSRKTSTGREDRKARSGLAIGKVLIANRGEIALRIIWACRELGIRTVAVYSEADRDSLHVRFADEEICIGPPPSAESYLNVPAVISAAEISDADAIHPGYGFLAENPQFAEICEECKIRFIGPRPEVIRMMGDKARARATAHKAGVPVLPGSDGLVSDLETAERLARKIGFPVIIKASAGGGGRGMRIVRAQGELRNQLETARSESAAVFGSGDLYLEKYLEAPRHIEIQLLADSHGNIVHLGERECSIQRRYQKLLEESPSAAVDADLRQRMGEAAIRIAESVGYENAGTVEFLLDQSSGEFYFMEMNTRIQVEHPVTEMVTSRDLVKEQIRVASGQPLSWSQSEVLLRGAAIECRINAEDPVTFLPSPGKIRSLYLPGGPGTRVDTAAYPECFIPPYYDSMIAKLVVHGCDRDEAIRRMRRALDACVIEGVSTTVPLLRKIMDDPDFIDGRLDTRFIQRFTESGSRR
jgi:acetyl-CoA carboxylase biotin carboxylase subunit